jgi:hypothetical protein
LTTSAASIPIPQFWNWNEWLHCGASTWFTPS